VKYMMQRRSCAAVKLTAMPRETQRNRAKNNRRNDAILVVWMAKANEKGMSRRRANTGLPLDAETAPDILLQLGYSSTRRYFSHASRTTTC